MKKGNRSSFSIIETFIICLMVILLVTAFVVVFSSFSYAFNTPYQTANIIIYLFTLLFAFILLVGCVLVNMGEGKTKSRFEGLILFSFLSTIFSLSSYLMNGKVDVNLAITMQISANVLLAAYWILFWFYQNDKYPKSSYSSIVTIVVIGYMALYLLFSLANYFVPIFFRAIDSNRFIYRTDYFSLIFFLLWYVFYLGYIFTRKSSLRVKVSLASYVAIPLALNLISMLLGANETFIELYYSLNSLCFLIPLYFIYFNLHIEHSRELYEQREELTAARINLMVSQIQPHFIYNSLTAIIGLIDVNPDQAKKSVVSFSDYLRVNLNALKDTNLIPFEKELEHSKTYLDFELLRFKNISVKYDIQVTDFKIPALTVQPILENAVKHGVTQTGHGGTVSLSTKAFDKSIEIIVSDNGVGFDVNEKQDGVHVGIENVRKRLKDMCGGELTITSEKGVGTTVVVSIPKENIQ